MLNNLSRCAFNAPGHIIPLRPNLGVLQIGIRAKVIENQEPDSPEASPASPDYVPGPEEPEQAPLSPDYVPGPEYPEYLALSDEEVPIEDQPYAIADSPIALSLGYVADSDPEEDSEDGLVDYPSDGGDGDDDDSSDDDDEEEEALEEEEDEYMAPADYVVAPRNALLGDLAAPALPIFTSIVPHPYGSPNHVRAPLGFRAAMGRLRASSPSTHHPLHPSPPLPPLPSSLHLHHMYTQHYIYLPITILPLPPNLPASLLIPPPVDYREDTPEAAVPPRKRLCLTLHLTSRYEVGESSTAAPRPTRGHGIDYRFIDTLDAETRHQKAEKVSYGIRDVWVDPTEAVEEVAPTTLKGVNARVTELTAVQEQDTQDVYAVIEDTQDRQTHEAWAHFVELSSAVHYELQAYRTHTQMQDFRQIQELQARGHTHADDREGAVAGTTGAIVQEHRLRCTMPNARDVDHHDTSIYIPLYYRTGGFTGNERDIYQSLVYRLFHEGRIMLPDFLEDEPNLRPTSGAHEVNEVRDSVMSSASSAVTYTYVYTNSEPGRVFWGADEELSDRGPEHPPSPNYVPGPEHPPSPVEPLPANASPTALSPGCVVESDLDEDPEEDPEEDHANYPADGGDGDDEPSDDYDDEDEDPFKDEDDDKEEERLAPADSSAIPVVDHVPSAGDTEAFETDEAAPKPLPSPKRHTARILLALPIPPPSSLSPWSSLLPQIPSLPPLPPPSSLHLPPHVPTSLPLPSSPLPPLPASLFIPPPVDRRKDIPEAELPSHKRLCPTAPTSRYEVGESLIIAPRPTRGLRADYGFISTIDAKIKRARHLGCLCYDQGCSGQTDSEALLSREAWAHSVGLSSVVHYELQAYRTHTQMQDYRIASQEPLMTTLIAQNNMPPRRSSATARATVVAATHMTVATGTEGVVVLSQWFKKMESMFYISNCATVTQDVACAMDWKALKKMMTVKYRPKGEIKKLEIELSNLKVKGYFTRNRMKVEKYVGGLPDMIRGNVMSYQPKMMEKAIEFTNGQLDQKVLTITERQAEQKRKLEFNAGNNQGHQQQNKRQNIGRAYTAGPGEKREYTRSLPLSTKCNYHHKGPCAPRCNKYKKISHLACNCRSSNPNGINNNHRNSRTTQNAGTCYECGV
ncbi:hypothetical protein Tco_0602536 [Tanacetum coccineum]